MSLYSNDEYAYTGSLICMETGEYLGNLLLDFFEFMYCVISKRGRFENVIANVATFSVIPDFLLTSLF